MSYTRAAVVAVVAAGLALAGCSTTTTDQPPTTSASVQPSAPASQASSAPATTDTPTPTPTETPTPDLPNAATLWKNARTASTQQETVKVVGKLVEDDVPMTITVAGTMDGRNSTLTVTSGELSYTGLTVAGKGYVKGNAAFWKNSGADDATAKKMASKWVASTQTNTEFTPKALLDGMFSEDLNWLSSASVRVERTTLGGKPAILLADRGTGKGTGQIWMTDDPDKPLPLKLSGTDDDGSPLDFTFTEWNEVKPVKAPPADQIIQP